MIRLDRMQRGLYEALDGVAGTVSWAMGEAPRGEGTLLSLRLTGGPTPGLRKHGREVLLDAATLVDVQVTSAVAGDRAVVELNDFPYIVDVGGGDTVTDVRDAFVALVTELDGDTIAATAASTDRVQLTPNSAGAIRSVTLSGPLGLAAPVTHGDAVAVTEGTSTAVIELQAFSLDRTPRGGAVSILAEAMARLQRPDVLELLQRWGVAIYDLGDVTDLSAIAGSHWESRALAGITIAMRSTAVAPVGFIENVSADIEVVDVETVTASTP